MAMDQSDCLILCKYIIILIIITKQQAVKTASFFSYDRPNVMFSYAPTHIITIMLIQISLWEKSIFAHLQLDHDGTS